MNATEFLIEYSGLQKSTIGNSFRWVVSAMEAWDNYLKEEYPNQQPVNGYSREQMEECFAEGVKAGRTFDELPTPRVIFERFIERVNLQPVNDGWRVYNTGVDITDQCTFESGIITINSDVAKIKANHDEPRCY